MPESDDQLPSFLLESVVNGDQQVGAPALCAFVIMDRVVHGNQQKRMDVGTGAGAGALGGGGQSVQLVQPWCG